MHFLIDASLPTAISDVIHEAGHLSTDVRDIGMRDADDGQIATLAQTQEYCLITGDNDFGNVRDYPPEDYAGIIVIQPPQPPSRLIILDMVAGLLRQSELIANLKGRLAIVQPGRVRLRPSL